MISWLLLMIYLAFVSLGLPDSLLGAAWPAVYPDFSVPVSYAGGISMIIAVGTIVSSLQSDRQTRMFGAGKVTAFSVLLTAMSLFGFSISRSYPELCLWAIPYGLGAGGVDAALNNYVALHYASRHMSWLHCMWGIGASIGPYIMGYVLSDGQGWRAGYFYIGLIQLLLTGILFTSLPLWKQNKQNGDDGALPDKEAKKEKPLSLRQVIQIPGAKEVMGAFFCYSAIEQTVGLWASSFLVLQRGLTAETAAGFASMFYLGITAGRMLSGFLTLRFDDNQMIRLGIGGVILGLSVLVLPFGKSGALVGLIVIGLGCAPIYPSIIHATPERFGPEKSQAIIGVQMASAYVGTCVMPPVFGVLANHAGVWLFPIYLAVFSMGMGNLQRRMERKLSS